MMIRAAGSPGQVSPLDFNERKQPLPRTTWIAIGLVAAAHVAVGVVLYYQRFELAAQPTPEEPPIFKVTFDPPPKPPVVQPTPKTPAAPNAIHKTAAPSQPTSTLPATTTDGPPIPGPTITIAEKVADPIDTGPPATTTQPEPPAVITNPSWIRQPTANQMMQAYPNRAITAGISGSVSLNCSVRADGSVGDCAVTRETPGNYGFGRAAQGLSRYFRINPRTVNGAAVDGARVAINLRFTLPTG